MNDLKKTSPSSSSTPIVFQNKLLMKQLIDIRSELVDIRVEIKKSRYEVADREHRILKRAVALIPIIALALLKIWDLLLIN